MERERKNQRKIEIPITHIPSEIGERGNVVWKDSPSKLPLSFSPHLQQSIPLKKKRQERKMKVRMEEGGKERMGVFWGLSISNSTNEAMLEYEAITEELHS
jgi:hypothetical protein